MTDAALLAGLDHARELVQADGGDLVLVAADAAAGSVHLRLVLEGANCAECVMPRSFLEQVTLDLLRKQAPQVTSVTIDDPRETG